MRPPQAILPSLAALLLAAPILAALVLAAPGSARAAAWNGSEHTACLARAGGQPAETLEYALSWQAQGGGEAARHCQAAALIGLGRYAEAARIYEELVNSPVAESSPGGRAALLGEAGNAWLLANDLGRARASLDAAIALAPLNANLRVDRALVLALGGEYWKAIDDLNKADDLEPDRLDVLIYRATAYRYVEAYDMAGEDIGKALALAPDNPDALLERGNLRRIAGDDSGARADWLRILQVAPDSPAAASARDNLAALDMKSD